MEFSDIRYVKTSGSASVISPDQVIAEALKARDVLSATSTPFQRMLERMMFEEIHESREGHRTEPTLLSVNPHMNIKAVMAAHPEQDVFYADGAIQIQKAAAPVAAMHPTQYQNRLPEPVVHVAENEAFRQVIAPTALSALAMGTGVRARAEVRHPDHMHHLFKRTAATPVGKVNYAYVVRNDHTFWDK